MDTPDGIDSSAWVADLLWIRSGVGLTPLVVVFDEGDGRVLGWQSSRIVRRDLARDAVELAHHDRLRSGAVPAPVVVFSSERLRRCPDIDAVGGSVGDDDSGRGVALVDGFERWFRAALDARSGRLVGHDDVEWAVLESVEAFNHLTLTAHASRRHHPPAGN